MPARGIQHLPIRYPREAPAWFAQFMDSFIRDVLTNLDVRNAIQGQGIQIEGTPDQPATISSSEDVQQLMDENYILAEPSAFLANARVLSGENGVVSVTDEGPSGSFVISLEQGGIPYSKLAELDELSVLGNPTDAFGPLTRITGSAQHDVLSVQLNGSDLEVRFGTITHQSVSDFDEAAQDAVGGILTDTATIDLTYSDATPSITADVKDDSITYAKMQNVTAASKLIGRGSASGAGDPEEITIGSGLTMAGTTLSASGGSGGIDPTLRFEDYDDMMRIVGYGAASGTTDIGAAGHPGIARVTTGSSTSTSAGFLRALSTSAGAFTVFPGGGELTFEALVRIPTLYAGGNTGQIRVGFMDEISGAPTNGIHAQYESGTANWVLYCRDGSASFTVGSTAVVANAWTHVKIVVNAAGTSAELFIDGVSQGSLTTNIPTSGFTYGAESQKTAGTTAAIIDVDYIHVKQVFTVAR